MAVIDQLLVNESGRIAGDMYKKNLYRGPWGGSMIESEFFPEGMGAEINVLTYDRVQPASPMEWTSVAYNTGAGNTCLPTAQVITPAQTLRSWGLSQGALESAPLCVNDVRYSLNFREQLAAVYKGLMDNGYDTWQNRYRDEYTRVSEHKMIVHTSIFPEDDAAFPLVAPTSTLSQGVLDSIYLMLLREADEFKAGMKNGLPVFTAVLGPETSRNLQTENVAFKEAINYAYTGAMEGSPFLKNLGVEFTLKGFYHLIDLFPPRWNFSGGAWVRVQPYTTEAATQGTKSIVNPAYLTALYEDTIIFVKSVMKSQVPKPIGAAGGNVDFKPQEYRGEFKWLNYATDLNKDQTWGYFRGLFMQASKPIHPEHGYVLRHLRCGLPMGLRTCTA